MSSKLLKIIPFIFFEVYWAVPLSEHGYNILCNTMSILANTYFPTFLVLWGVDSQQWPFVPSPPSLQCAAGAGLSHDTLSRAWTRVTLHTHFLVASYQSHPSPNQPPATSGQWNHSSVTWEWYGIRITRFATLQDWWAFFFFFFFFNAAECPGDHPSCFGPQQFLPFVLLSRAPLHVWSLVCSLFIEGYLTCFQFSPAL